MSDITKLSDRVEKLEKSNRRLKTALFCVAALGCATLLMGAAAAKKIIEGERFVFKDGAGKERLTLDSGPNGPVATLMDINGKPSFKVVINKDGFFQMPPSSSPAKPANHPAPEKK